MKIGTAAASGRTCVRPATLRVLTRFALAEAVRQGEHLPRDLDRLR